MVSRHYAVKLLRLKALSHQRLLDDLEDISRRRNLVIFYFPEPDRENADVLKKGTIEDMIGQKLGVDVISVERVHRIGNKRQDRHRPVIMNLFYYNEKLTTKKLSQTERIHYLNKSRFFHMCILAKRSKLWSSSGKFKTKGSKVSLHYDEVRVDGDLYEWDEHNDCLKCIQAKDDGIGLLQIIRRRH